MGFFVNAVEFVAVPGGIAKIYFRRPMTIDTPAHAQLGELFHLVHLLDRPMTGLALYLARPDMLCMAKEDMIGQPVDLDPLYRFARLGIPAGLGVIAGIAV